MGWILYNVQSILKSTARNSDTQSSSNVEKATHQTFEIIQQQYTCKQYETAKNIKQLKCI